MGSANGSETDLAARVARLSAGQRECLDLVDDHATSKEIARVLGISRHTVDARLRGAIQTLGVSSRREAAVIYRAAVQAQGYQPFAYQPPQIVPGAQDAENLEQAQPVGDYSDAPGADRSRAETSRFPQGPAFRQPPEQVFEPRLDLVSDSAVWSAVSPGAPGASGTYVPARPLLRLWGGANDLTPTQRMLGILVVMILAMLAFGILLSGIEALTLLRS